MNLSDIAILNIKSDHYRCIISGISKNRAINLIQNLLSHIKTAKEILTFGDIEIEKNKFYHQKTPIFLKDVDIEKSISIYQYFFS